MLWLRLHADIAMHRLASQGAEERHGVRKSRVRFMCHVERHFSQLQVHVAKVRQHYCAATKLLRSLANTNDAVQSIATSIIVQRKSGDTRDGGVKWATSFLSQQTSEVFTNASGAVAFLHAFCSGACLQRTLGQAASITAHVRLHVLNESLL